MQSRFWLSTHNEYLDAVGAKNKLAEQFTDRVYQIRKGREGNRIVFRVVERLSGQQANVVNETKKPTGYTKRPSKRQRRERDISAILQ